MSAAHYAPMATSSVFLTGASRGIGRALAVRLAARGLHVCLAARDQEALESVRAEIEAGGGEASVWPLDVSDPARVTEVMRAADDAREGIELVVANAGVTVGRWSGKMTYDDIASVIDVNVRGATATLLALLPAMVARGRGHLVGVSSLARYRASPKMAAYSASKAYFSAFVEGLRLDLQRTQIAVTDIRPGFVETDLVQGMKRMPFLIGAEDAAARIDRAIQGRVRVAEFPLPMATLVRAASNLPDALYERAVR